MTQPVGRPRRAEARRAWVQAGADSRVELVLQLRDLVHDHLGPGGVLHHLRPGVEQRRPGGDLVGLADHRRAHPDHRLLHVGAGLRLSDGGRPLLVGGQARRAGLGVVHRLVQRHRPGRCGRVGGLRGGDLRLDAVQPLGARPRRHRLRRRGVAGRHLLGVRRPVDPARADQHLLVAPRRAVQQHLGLLARGRRGGDHRDPRLRPRTAIRASTSSSPRRRTTPASATACSGGTCCRSASC